MVPYSVLYDEVLIEEQPFIYDHKNQPEQRLMNFRLQQIDIGLRGLVLGMGKKLVTVTPRAVRCYLGTSMGDHALNKQEHIKYCQNLNLFFKEVPAAKRNHISDTVCNCIFLLSKQRKKFHLNDLCKFEQPHGAFSKRWQEYNAQPEHLTSPSNETGSGSSGSQENDSPDE